MIVRTLQYRMTETEDGRKIEGVLRSKGYSAQNIKELKKKEGLVFRNYFPVYLNERVHTGDILEVHIEEEVSSPKIEPVPLPLGIVYEDEDLMVLNKPAGMPTHPSQNNYDNTLANGLCEYFRRKNRPFVFRCVNRLDRDTSGLTIIAKHYLSASKLSSIEQKGYLAICEGMVTPSEGTIDAPLGRKEGSIIERTVDYEHGERAVTHYQVLESNSSLSLVRLRLDTGRTHQIRIHMKYLGYPIIGDYLYHPVFDRIGRQALHSAEIAFFHPVTGEMMHFEAPMPEDMRHAFYDV